MAKPEDGGRSCRLGLASLGVAVLTAAALTVCVVCLDARRQHQLAELTDQLDHLRQLVYNMQKQLDLHEGKLNSTVHSKNTISEPAEEVVYEDEYEYDDVEEDSYEYDDEKDRSPKGTVKRTTVPSDSTSEAPHTSRSRRAVPVRDESIVESSEAGRRAGEEPREHKRRQHSRHQSQSSGYQELRRPAESEVRLRHQHLSRNRNAKSDVEFISQNSGEDRYPEERPCHILAAHFIGDPSKYNTREHNHYYGNNILYHPQGLFRDWTPSQWMISEGTDLHFPLSNGKLSIQKPGLYFVYAQIYYAATHDRCGFHIKQNGIEVAQCMTMTPGITVKRNTCFTAVVLHLQQSDQLWISEMEGHRNTSFKWSHSFFGLIQLNPS